MTVGTTPVSLGASPGDGFEPDPYLYVGPQNAERPGDPGTGTRRSAPCCAPPTSPSGDAGRLMATEFLRTGLRRFTLPT